jgi:hypothetical protein
MDCRCTDLTEAEASFRVGGPPLHRIALTQVASGFCRIKACSQIWLRSSSYWLRAAAAQQMQAGYRPTTRASREIGVNVERLIIDRLGTDRLRTRYMVEQFRCVVYRMKTMMAALMIMMVWVLRSAFGRMIGRR